MLYCSFAVFLYESLTGKQQTGTSAPWWQKDLPPPIISLLAASAQLLLPPELLERQSMLILLLPGDHVLQGVLCLDSSTGCIKSDAKLEDELSV